MGCLDVAAHFFLYYFCAAYRVDRFFFFEEPACPLWPINSFYLAHDTPRVLLLIEVAERRVIELASMKVNYPYSTMVEDCHLRQDSNPGLRITTSSHKLFPHHLSILFDTQFESYF